MTTTRRESINVIDLSSFDIAEQEREFARFQQQQADLEFARRLVQEEEEAQAQPPAPAIQNAGPPRQIIPQQHAPQLPVLLQAAPRQVIPPQPVPQQAAPQRPAPQQAAPQQAAPQRPAPLQAAHREIIPPRTAPQQAAPRQIILPWSASQQPAPQRPAPEQFIPPQAAPQQPAPQRPAPQQFSPPQPAPQHAASQRPAPQQFIPPQPAPQQIIPPRPAPQRPAPRQFIPLQPAPQHAASQRPAPQQFIPPQPAPQQIIPPRPAPQQPAPEEDVILVSHVRNLTTNELPVPNVASTIRLQNQTGTSGPIRANRGRHADHFNPISRVPGQRMSAVRSAPATIENVANIDQEVQFRTNELMNRVRGLFETVPNQPSTSPNAQPATPVDSNDCVLCFEKPVEGRACNSCMNVIGCNTCVMDWFRQAPIPSCPLCRRKWNSSPNIVTIATLQKRLRERDQIRAQINLD